MSPITILILAAGFTIVLFLLLAALVWGIRTRRGEENFIPAQPAGKQGRRGLPESQERSEAVPEWLRGTMTTTSDSRDKPDEVPEWLQAMKSEISGGDVDFEESSIGGEAFSPWKDLFGGSFPQLSTLITLGNLVRQIQAAEGRTDAPAERLAAMQQAVEKLLETQPQNEFLLRLRDSLQSARSGEGFDEGQSVQVIQVAGRNAIRADGVEYASVIDIPDPALREQARSLLAAYDLKERAQREVNSWKKKSDSGSR